MQVVHSYVKSWIIFAYSIKKVTNFRESVQCNDNGLSPEIGFLANLGSSGTEAKRNFRSLIKYLRTVAYIAIHLVVNINEYLNEKWIDTRSYNVQKVIRDRKDNFGLLSHQ